MIYTRTFQQENPRAGQDKPLHYNSCTMVCVQGTFWHPSFKNIVVVSLGDLKLYLRTQSLKGVSNSKFLGPSTKGPVFWGFNPTSQKLSTFFDSLPLQTHWSLLIAHTRHSASQSLLCFLWLRWAPSHLALHVYRSTPWDPLLSVHQSLA